MTIDQCKLDMSVLSDEEIDALILAEASNRYQKVAKILGDIVVRYENWDGDRLTARMVALVDAGQLQAEGNLQRWGWSEVRFPQTIDFLK